MELNPHLYNVCLKEEGGAFPGSGGTSRNRKDTRKDQIGPLPKKLAFSGSETPMLVAGNHKGRPPGLRSGNPSLSSPGLAKPPEGQAQ